MPTENRGSSSAQGNVGTGGSSGGDNGDGDKPPSSPTTGAHSADDMVPIEDDEEEEDVMAPDQTMGTPTAPHSAPSKGKSPAHRQIRHQRNARRILDSWMADEDPNQSRNDCKTF